MLRISPLCKPNSNPNLTLTNSKTSSPLTLILTLTLLQVRYMIAWPNIAQFAKCCAIDKLISGAARLVKSAIDQMRATSFNEWRTNVRHYRKK